MAYELQLKQSQDKVKLRNQWVRALLAIITLVIYDIV